MPKIIPMVNIDSIPPNKFGVFSKNHVASDHLWSFENQNMDFTKDLKLKGKYCYHPFNTITVDKYGDVYMCICQSWLPVSIGKIWEFETFEEIVNSPKALEIQSSIIDGSYRYCDHNNCSIIKENELSGRIEHKYRSVNWINFAVDDSCNLTCPSCRKEFKFLKEGKDYDLKIKIVNHLTKLIENHPLYLKFTLSSDGDPFASSIYRHFLSNLNLEKQLFNIDGSYFNEFDTKNEKLRQLKKDLIEWQIKNTAEILDNDRRVFTKPEKKVEIELVTNGILLKDHWHKLYKIHNNIIRTKISFDAGSEKIYNITRKGGNWKKLLSNAKFLIKWKEKNYSAMVTTANFVVQTANYKDMPAFVDLCDKIGFDEINFQKITDWGTYHDFNSQAIWKENHPEYKNFLNILKNLNNKKINFTNITDLKQIVDN